MTQRPRQKTLKTLEREVAAFNATFPVGSPVLYRSHRDAAGQPTSVREPAWVLSGHTAVCMVKGVAGCVACDALYVDPIINRGASESDA